MCVMVTSFLALIVWWVVVVVVVVVVVMTLLKMKLPQMNEHRKHMMFAELLLMVHVLVGLNECFNT